MSIKTNLFTVFYSHRQGQASDFIVSPRNYAYVKEVLGENIVIRNKNYRENKRENHSELFP